MQVPRASLHCYDHHHTPNHPDGSGHSGQLLDLPDEAGWPGMPRFRHQHQAEPFNVHLLLCSLCSILLQRLSQAQKFGKSSKKGLKCLCKTEYYGDYLFYVKSLSAQTKPKLKNYFNRYIFDKASSSLTLVEF